LSPHHRARWLAHLGRGHLPQAPSPRAAPASRHASLLPRGFRRFPSYDVVRFDILGFRLLLLRFCPRKLAILTLARVLDSLHFVRPLPAVCSAEGQDLARGGCKTAEPWIARFRVQTRCVGGGRLTGSCFPGRLDSILRIWLSRHLMAVSACTPHLSACRNLLF